MPERVEIALAPAEHTAYQWLPWREAAAACLSWSNRGAILLLPQRNPVITAKTVATLDHMVGGGRVLLGIGVGWLAEEFAALGVSFEDRGPRTDEYVAAMRALWSQAIPKDATIGWPHSGATER